MLKLADKQSKAKRINILFKKYRKFARSYMDMANFEEPCLLLMRNDRRIEFFEKATQGVFEFDHTDGGKGRIELNPSFLHTFMYGRKNFRGYICHEDFPTPLPENPLITARTYATSIDKIANDMNKWKTDRTKAISGLVWKIALGIAIIIGALALGSLFAPEFINSLNPFTSSSPAQSAIQNTSAIASASKTVIP